MILSASFHTIKESYKNIQYLTKFTVVSYHNNFNSIYKGTLLFTVEGGLLAADMFECFSYGCHKATEVVLLDLTSFVENIPACHSFDLHRK